MARTNPVDRHDAGGIQGSSSRPVHQMMSVVVDEAVKPCLRWTRQRRRQRARRPRTQRARVGCLLPRDGAPSLTLAHNTDPAAAERRRRPALQAFL